MSRNAALTNHTTSGRRNRTQWHPPMAPLYGPRDGGGRRGRVETHTVRIPGDPTIRTRIDERIGGGPISGAG